MADDIESRVAKLEARVRQLETRDVRASATTAQATASDKLTPREFLLDRAPKTDNDKTLTAGYWLEILSGAESFDFDNIEQFYGAAKEAPPANRRDPPYQNVKKGYFREVGKREAGMKARNRWALTNSGIERVERGFAHK